MKLKQNKAETIKTKMFEKPSFLGINISKNGAAHVWVGDHLRYCNCLIYNNGNLTYTAGNAYRTSGVNNSSITSVCFSGRHKLLLEEEGGQYCYYNRKTALPNDLSFLALFNHGAKLFLIVAEKTFCRYPVKLALENSSEAQHLLIAAFHDIIQRSDSSAAELLNGWVKDMRYPLGKP